MHGCMFANSYLIKLFIIPLFPRITNTIHTLIHEPTSIINKICNHTSIIAIVTSTILNFSFESLFSSDIVSTKMIHNSHHAYPTIKGKDYSYNYTIAPYRSFEAKIRAFCQPEFEFISSLNFVSHEIILFQILFRIFMFCLLFRTCEYSHVLFGIFIQRLIRGVFYYRAFHLAHMDSDGETLPKGMNWEPQSTFLTFINTLLIGRLSIEEGWGHAVHHTHSTKKSRFYEPTPTHTYGGNRLLKTRIDHHDLVND
jgi:hypothetical protein